MMSAADRKVVSGVLRDFPRLCSAVRSREAYLLSLCASSNPMSARVGGAVGMPAQDRFVEALSRDREYQELLSVVEAVGGALSTLSPESAEVARMYFFAAMPVVFVAERLGRSRGFVERRLRSCCDRAAGAVFTTYPVVRRWRAAERIRGERFAAAAAGFTERLKSCG